MDPFVLVYHIVQNVPISSPGYLAIELAGTAREGGFLHVSTSNVVRSFSSKTDRKLGLTSKLRSSPNSFTSPMFTSLRHTCV